jgi:hypothetical protein
MDLIHLWKLMALLCHGLTPRALYSGREKFGFEGIFQTLTMIGASEGPC